MPNDCLNPYSVTKVAGEELCKMYYRLFGLKTIIFRYFNVYGERQPVKGQYAPLIGIFLRQVDNKEPMTIVGSGKQRRDFTHVRDVANINHLAATAADNNVFGETFNVGVGTNYSVLEVANMIGGKCVHIPERLGEAKETLADISKAKNLLGWKPTIFLPEWIQNNRNFCSGAEIIDAKRWLLEGLK